MNTVYRYLDITCKDASGRDVYFYTCDYDENIDEINIRSHARSFVLQRGWIGDLTYTTAKAMDLESGKDVEEVVKSEYKDVLLAKITPWSMDDGVITWEYKFLKK